MPGGYRELMSIAAPLMLSTSSTSLMHVVDRVLLSRYSADAMAASMPASATSFVFVSFFLGLAGYVSTFVAQYDGAGRPRRIGASVWQGIYLGIVSTVLLALISLASEPIFRAVGHAPSIQREEITYFRILTLFGGGMILSAALSAFYSGRGKTWTVMCVETSGVVVNAILAICLIFGVAGFPRWGIAGAGVATVSAKWYEMIVYLLLLFGRRNRIAYGTWSGRRIDRELIGRVLYYGFPTGLHFMADILAFTIFMLMIGRIGPVQLAASTVAFSINALIFFPMLGMAMATATLVGRYLGANRPDDAARATHSAMVLTVLYMSTFALALIRWPNVFLSAFHPADSPAVFEEITHVGYYLLYFVACYSFVDGGNIIYAAALKGAGDTRYVLFMLMAVATAVLILPMVVARVFFDAGIYASWTILTAYIMALALSYWWRYRRGHWRTMRVIEHIPVPVAAVAEGPVVEA